MFSWVRNAACSLQVTVIVLACGISAGLSQESPVAGTVSEGSLGTKRALIICGIPGDDEHHELFSESIESLYTALTTTLEFPAENVHIQFGDDPAEEDGPAVSAAGGKATRSELSAAVADLRKELQPADTLWVFVMGHAHYDGQKSYLNLPGAGEGESDMHEDDFAKLFQDLAAKQQVFFITTPVSGFFTRPLSAEGRIVITATEADREVNETLFHAALAETLAAPPTKEEFDVDTDDKTTLFDLYITVTRNVARRYTAEMLLATEHAQLDDNGDGRGTELQLDYLTEEEGGRATEEGKPPTIRPNSDGFLSQQTQLTLKFPEPEPAEEAPELPSS